MYDSITAAGGITSVNIDKSMMNYVRSSRGQYMDKLKRKRDEQSAEDRERKRAAEAIQSLKAKKRKLEADAAHETRVIDSEIADLERIAK